MLVTLLSSAAVACGGLFCTPAIAPVDQAAEEIVFAHDRDAGEVEMHVTITWQGEADDFAWILPVPAEPELFLSDVEMFQTLSFATMPQFLPRYENIGRCGPIRIGCSAEYALNSAPQSTSGVTVIDEQQLGPYETVTLKADSSTALLDWLTARDYDLPSDLDPLLAPYVAADSHFVAMRLASDSEVGDIEPVGLRYAATTLAIPIQLTAVAAADDMPVRVYVFADDRAVPESYLDVTINEAAIDWPTGGQNYPEVLAAAVDAAGGQAFVTEYAGESRVVGTGGSPMLDGLVRDYPYLTRMTTALSADEMTVDPTFVVKPGLPDVDNVHTARVERDCRGGGDDNAPQTVFLRDGREIHLGEIGFRTRTENRIADLQDTPALLVRDLVEGKDAVLVDYSDDALADLDAHNEAMATGGCGCDSAPGSAGLAGLLGLMAVLRRRRITGR